MMMTLVFLIYAYGIATLLAALYQDWRRSESPMNWSNLVVGIPVVLFWPLTLPAMVYLDESAAEVEKKSE
jgi:4-amino-4-deoxy-L-arabinose transferase-like glycosyltransferase